MRHMYVTYNVKYITSILSYQFYYLIWSEPEHALTGTCNCVHHTMCVCQKKNNIAHTDSAVHKVRSRQIELS